MDIVTALGALASVQSAITITSPLNIGIRRVYIVPPNSQTQLTDLPCWINGWTLTGVRRKTTGGVIDQSYTIHSQLYVEDASIERACLIASAFLQPFIIALQRNIGLSGTVAESNLRGGDPTLALLERGGKGYPGLDLFIDVVLRNSVVYA